MKDGKFSDERVGAYVKEAIGKVGQLDKLTAALRNAGAIY